MQHWPALATVSFDAELAVQLVPQAQPAAALDAISRHALALLSAPTDSGGEDSPLAPRWQTQLQLILELLLASQPPAPPAQALRIGLEQILLATPANISDFAAGSHASLRLYPDTHSQLSFSLPVQVITQHSAGWLELRLLTAALGENLTTWEQWVFQQHRRQLYKTPK